MRISVQFATIRSGWLENTFRALGAQTLPHEEWEFVMVDDYGDRWLEVKALAEKYKVNTKYMCSKPYKWKSNRQLGNARNTGLIYSDGELMVFLDDYSWVERDWLKLHWRTHVKTGMAVIGVVYGVKLKTDTVNSLQDLTIESSDERLKDHTFDGPCRPGWFWTFNASAPLGAVLAVNGYDERLDCAGEDDVDLGLRMARLGVKFWYCADPRIAVYHMRHNGGLSRPSPFKVEECDKFTKEALNVRYDGSWGLLEDNARKQPWEVNVGYFSLRKARSAREHTPVKEVRI